MRTSELEMRRGIRMLRRWFKRNTVVEAVSEAPCFSVSLDRESVCMGDDAMSHKGTRDFPLDIKVSDFIAKLTKYVPNMKDSVWLIWGEQETIGYLIFDSTGKAEIEVEGTDNSLRERLSTAEIPSVTCIYYYRSKFSWIEESPGETLLEKVKAARKARTDNKTS